MEISDRHLSDPDRMPVLKGEPRRGGRAARRRSRKNQHREPVSDHSRRRRKSIGHEVRQPDRLGDTVLLCKDLSQDLDDQPVLRRVAFEIRAGRAYAVTGGAGSGKTTLVRAVCGLLAPTGGSVLLRGRPVDRMDPETLGRSVSYVRHSVATVAAASVAETVRFWGRLSGLSRAAAQERTVEVLERFDLTDLADRPFDDCTSGVQREVSLAVALLRRPALLVLDEPCRRVDAGTQDRLIRNLRSLRDEGVALLYASRDTDQAHRVGDHVGVLRDGWLSWDICPEQRSPAA
ncbi:ATP-binding cassette domain-containing protein [Micromonospora sp. NPDC051925]|uniref:ATP-binding cassette domain-containing protein n=1 Tax=Micromonospora sp. NPDC051925 TaxID=3364288 RepID=UPI0037CBA130